jgi:hypothetical protein
MHILAVEFLVFARKSWHGFGMVLDYPSRLQEYISGTKYSIKTPLHSQAIRIGKLASTGTQKSHTDRTSNGDAQASHFACPSHGSRHG